MTFILFFPIILYLLCGVVTVLFGSFILYALYLLYIRKLYAHIPGPPCSSFLLGHLKDIRQWRKNGGTYLSYTLKVRLDYGPIYVLFFLHHPCVYLAEPNWLKKVLIDNHKFALKNKYEYEKLGSIFGTRLTGDGLVTNTDDESWHKRRLLMNPAFHRKCLKNFMSVFNEVCDQFMVRLTQIAVDQKAQDVSMAQEFANVTVDIISQVSFNTNIGAIMDPNSPFTKAIATSLKGAQANLLIPVNATLLSLFKYWPFQTAAQKEQINAAKFLRQFARECATKRMKEIEAGRDTPDDLLDILVSDKSLSLEDIIDEFVTIFMAGQETTASSLGFTLLEIARNPDVEAKILTEVNSVLGSREYVEFEDLSQLKYLGQVMQESLRMYPVAGGTSRILNKEMVLDRYKIPKGSWLRFPKYAFNHNPHYWENPDIFNPDRFSAPEKIPNFTTVYFPFNLGPRNCIGQIFSKFESKVILARMLRKFKFELQPGQTAALEERMTVAPRDGVMCKVIMR